MLLCANPGARYVARKEVIDRAIHRALESGWYILGDEVKRFEEAFSTYCGVRGGVGVGSGTEAIQLALRSLDIGPGDEVITVSHTATATIAAIELAGASPVLVDIEPDAFTIDPDAASAAITDRTRAIVPVHLYGQMADMDNIVSIADERGLAVIEDCAQAHGARYRGNRAGSMGRIGCFSFYPTKNLGALGDGGMLVTDDDDIAKRARRLREYGWDENRNAVEPGWNTRLDEIHAAVLSDLLVFVDADNDRRQQIASTYDRLLEDLDLVLPKRRPRAEHVFHLYVVQTGRRDQLAKHLRDRDIAPGIHYAPPVHMHDAYRGRIRVPAPLPQTEAAARHILSLPMYPEMTDLDVERVTDAVRSFFQG